MALPLSDAHNIELEQLESAYLSLIPRASQRRVEWESWTVREIHRRN